MRTLMKLTAQAADVWDDACERWIGRDYEWPCEGPCCEDVRGALVLVAQLLDVLLGWLG